MRLPPCDHDGCRHDRCDIGPWLIIARAVNRGDWDNSEGSAREALLIGLGSIEEPEARKAYQRLKGKGK